ncbi:MAG: hypothetical protein NC293_11695 [Roseburia sp.]|nr:hypothetical protein [Roseburia sp.]
MSTENEEISLEGEKLAKKFWEYIEARAQEKPDSIIFNSEKKEEFLQSYTKEYKLIINNYMKWGTTSLDSHKCAALFIIQCLKSEIFTLGKWDEEDTKINIYPQLVAIDIAFAFMLKCLQETLGKKRIKKKIKAYDLPMPYSCDKPYIDVMARILYYEKDKNELGLSYNLFELSDRLFLIEYLTLLQNGIEPLRLRDKSHD